MDIKEFMKNANREDGTQKTIAENMKDLGASDDAIEYAMYIITMQRKQMKKSAKKDGNAIIQSLEHKVKTQKNELRRLNGNSNVDYHDAERKACLVKDRFFKLSVAKGDKAKITINPCDGRVELKVPKGTDVETTQWLGALANKIMECDSFIPRTYRGTVYLHEGNMCVNMKTESKYNELMHFNVANQ